MVKDIAVDEHFDVFIDDRNDLGVTEGRREVEQSLAIHLALFFHEEIGSVDKDNAKARLELAARRVASQNDRIDTLRSVIVTESSDEQNKFNIRILYDEDDEFELEVP